MRSYRKFTTTLILLALLLASNRFVTLAHAATDSSAGAVLTLDLTASESVTIVATSTNYTFTLNGTTWAGTDSANVTGNGTSTLTVVANAFTDINLTDSGAGAAVIFGNSGANSFQDNFTVVLNNGSGAVTVANSVNFLDSSSFSVTADTINLNANVTTAGAQTYNSPVVLTADTILSSTGNGNITFNSTINGLFSLTVNTGGEIQVNGAITTANGNIGLNADEMAIVATINAGTGIVTLAPNTAGRTIDLGTETVGSLSLTDTEIDMITAGILRIGSSSAGNLSFTSLISPAGTDMLSLITGNEIVDGQNGTDVQVANLAIQAVNGIADSGNLLLDTLIDTLAALNTTSGGISILEVFNGGDLTVGTVDGVVGIRNEAYSGASPALGIQLETTNGDLTVNADIFNQRRNIFLVAQQGNGGSGDSLFTNNADISTAANNGQIRIDANNMTLAGGSTIAAPNRVILQDDPGASVPIAINLGGEDGTNTLGLTDAELDTVSTNGTLQIGHTNGGGTGDIAVTAPIDLTDGPSIPAIELISGAALDGSGGNVLTANILNLTAGTSIGSNGDPFVVSVTELTTTSGGNQFLSEADSLTWNSSNAGSGTMTLDDGTFLTGDGETITAAAVIVNNGVTLGGTGTVATQVNAQSGSTVAPGASPGLLSTGDVSLTAGANLNVEVNGTTTAGPDYDQLNVTGSVTINNTATLVTSGSVAGVPTGTTIVILNNDDTEAVSGTFAGLPEGAAVTINGQPFRISYNGGDGNDVVLIENTAPTLTSFTRRTPPDSLTNADSLVFQATFSEDVQNVDVADFTVNSTTTATVTAVSSVSASVYEVTVSGGDLADFNGVVGLDLSGSQNIQDLVGNALPTTEPATDETYFVDNAAPDTTALTLLNPTGVISNTQPTFSWTAATDIGSGVVSYTLQLTIGSDVQEFSVTGTSYTPGTALVTGDYTWTVKAHDAVGNASEFVTPAAGFTLEASSPSSDYQLFLPIVVKN